MSITYTIAPFVGWIVADLCKVAVDSIRNRRLNFRLLTYGGIPSSHASVVCTTATLIGAREGMNTASFALATTIAVLFMVDAINLRQWVGQHAKALNELRSTQGDLLPFRERVGHTPLEILAGIVVGIACGLVLHAVG